MARNPIGLYIHIPFCRSICHYCDFAKTSNFQESHVEAYFSRVYQDLQELLQVEFLANNLSQLESVFFGGGTPGLFASHYQPLLELIQDKLPHVLEVTIEANPEDISKDKLKVWRSLGINRLSMGVQTLNDRGLAILTRHHQAKQIWSSIELVQEQFDNFNLDLIYGWTGQTLAEWHQDLDEITHCGLTHLSCYNLIYESGTPLGRKLDRGVISPAEDELLAKMYELTCETLEARGWFHDEVSNWSLPDRSCRHNWLYWQDQAFLGIGCGAFGLWKVDHDLGFRYWYPKEFRAYLRRPTSNGHWQNFGDFVTGSGAELEYRTVKNWLYEYIGGGLRSADGIDLSLIERHTGLGLKPNGIVTEGLNRGLIEHNGSVLTLNRREWFRENGWSLELIRSFR